jgi:hypothetical protein
VPDPESPWADRLGRWWGCWFQPQHQHFVPCDNLVAELNQTGFEVVSVERGPATTGCDLSFALMLRISALAPSPLYRWRPPPTAADRVKRLAVLTAVFPALAAAIAADAVKDGWARRPGNPATSNAYRVVARRR